MICTLVVTADQAQVVAAPSAGGKLAGATALLHWLQGEVGGYVEAIRPARSSDLRGWLGYGDERVKIFQARRARGWTCSRAPHAGAGRAFGGVVARADFRPKGAAVHRTFLRRLVVRRVDPRGRSADAGRASRSCIRSARICRLLP